MLEPQIQIEIEQARAARLRGNEGMARVCARRAAGLAAKTYLQQYGHAPLGPSAHDHLRALQNVPDLPSRARQAVERLLLRVNEDFQLPAGIDLIEEAQVLANMLS
jgi:hypothetical protein